MATFTIKQKNEPSQRKNVIDINIRTKKYKNYLKISIAINILLFIAFTYSYMLLKTTILVR